MKYLSLFSGVEAASLAWMTVVMLVPAEESVTCYPFCEIAGLEDFK